jgi:glutamine synthetase
VSQDLRAEIIDTIAQQQIEFINLQFTDILGMVKSVTIPVDKLEEALDYGIWFDGSSIEGFVRIVESDMYLVPDLTTYAHIPWNEHGVATARMICDVYTPDGKRFAGDPRYVLANVMHQAAELGYNYKVGPELEFFLFKPDQNGRVLPIPQDSAGYFDISTDYAAHVRHQMTRALRGLGIAVEASHHEVAPGQHEIDLSYGDAVHTADHLVTARVAIKAIAQQHGLYATFMPKPIANLNGSGMHVHQNLTNLLTDKNVFFDPTDSYGLSKIGRQFIAGLLTHAHGMSAVLSPLVNSYKRLVAGYEGIKNFEAPVYVSWGHTNRSALVRVPRTSRDRPHTTRVELRCPDPSCNPYLAFAVMLAAGLDGIKQRLSLGEAAEEDLFRVDPRARGMEILPRSLGEALDALKKDEVIQTALGPHIYERFMEAKMQEWDSYCGYISRWEIERYLHIF